MKRYIAISCMIYVTALLVLVLGVPRAESALIVGMDFGGADITVANGDILSGTFTNVGVFTVPAGVTVHVDPGVPLSITADSIVIDGILDGSGAGFAGGLGGPATGDGTSGIGPGGGEGGGFGGCVHASGGGGAGYGGQGGDSGSYFGNGPPPALGGSIYGLADSLTSQLGSGGGGAGSHCVGFQGLGGDGGNGGASIILTASQIIHNGTILANGSDGAEGTNAAFWSVSGGGGGSGGSILMTGLLILNGTLSAAGGQGANFSGPTQDQFAEGGGGGSGGRIKLFGVCVLGDSYQHSVSGGNAGDSTSLSAVFATDGEDGTYHEGCVHSNIQITKDYRFTNVCFEQDNDGDGLFNEDPVEGLNGDRSNGKTDNDQDGKVDEDGIDCPKGTKLGTQLPIDESTGKFMIEAFTSRSGKVFNYDPRKFYAVSSITPLENLETLWISEQFGECTEGDSPLSALSTKISKGGGSVVIVEVDVNGVAYQIADVSFDNVTVIDEDENGIPDKAEAHLEDIPGDHQILMYVKFKPGLIGDYLPADPDNMCDNIIEATSNIEEFEVTVGAEAGLIVQ